MVSNRSVGSNIVGDEVAESGNPKLLASFLLLAGVYGAAQFGKLLPAIPELVATFGDAQASFLISVFELAGALLGAVAGTYSRRFGQRRLLIIALWSFCCTNIVLSTSSTLAALYAARILESFAYLFVITCIPPMIAGLLDGRDRTMFLGLWSAFFPVGMAVGAFITTAMGVSANSFRYSMFAFALIGGALAIIFQRNPASAQPLEEGQASIAKKAKPQSFWLAVGFGFVSTMFVGFISVQTLMLTRFSEMDDKLAGLLVSIMSLSTAMGVFAPRLVRSPLPDKNQAQQVINLILLILVLVGAAVCVLYLGPNTRGYLMASIAICILVGCVVALVFAGLPALERQDDISSANGLVAQFGAIGALLGPPIFIQTLSVTEPAAVVSVALALLIPGLLFVLIASTRSSAEG